MGDRFWLGSGLAASLPCSQRASKPVSQPASPPGSMPASHPRSPSSRPASREARQLEWPENLVLGERRGSTSFVIKYCPILPNWRFWTKNQKKGIHTQEKKLEMNPRYILEFQSGHFTRKCFQNTTVTRRKKNWIRMLDPLYPAKVSIRPICKISILSRQVRRGSHRIFFWIFFQKIWRIRPYSDAAIYIHIYAHVISFI